jgi:hypothetical protein
MNDSTDRRRRTVTFITESDTRLLLERPRRRPRREPDRWSRWAEDDELAEPQVA